MVRLHIVHGHDEAAKEELRKYILKFESFGEPIILDDSPSKGNTVIEKFEEYASEINIVLVLHTPDDEVTVIKSGQKYFQARPNVIFELGYFYGKLARKTGKVILLSKANTQIPSDLSGMVYIDISHGIEKAGGYIYNELNQWFK